MEPNLKLGDEAYFMLDNKIGFGKITGARETKEGTMYYLELPNNKEIAGTKLTIFPSPRDLAISLTKDLRRKQNDSSSS